MPPPPPVVVNPGGRPLGSTKTNKRMKEIAYEDAVAEISKRYKKEQDEHKKDGKNVKAGTMNKKKEDVKLEFKLDSNVNIPNQTILSRIKRSNDRVSYNQRAIRLRGFNPLNRALLNDPDVQSSKPKEDAVTPGTSRRINNTTIDSNIVTPESPTRQQNAESPPIEPRNPNPEEEEDDTPTIPFEEEHIESHKDVWKFKRITGHQRRGSSYNVIVEWENGEITPEPLNTIAEDDPVTCTIYAREAGLLETPGWKCFGFQKIVRRLEEDNSTPPTFGHDDVTEKNNTPTKNMCLTCGGPLESEKLVSTLSKAQRCPLEDCCSHCWVTLINAKREKDATTRLRTQVLSLPCNNDFYEEVLESNLSRVHRFSMKELLDKHTHEAGAPFFNERTS